VNGTAPCSKDLDGMFDAVRELGMPVPQVENIVLSESFAHRGAEILARTLDLVRGWRKKKPAFRPQALVVSDDICMRMAAMALVQSRVEIPGELTVVCLTNELAELHYGIPVVRYEMPIRQLAADLLEALQSRLEGKSPAPRRVAGSFNPSDTRVPVAA
jgi:DNA-binding LacI/PurR family transcriptional regulator